MTYQLTQSTELMENHIAADVLDAKRELFAFQTPAGAIVLVAIGDDGILRAAVEAEGNDIGWSVSDLSPDLASPVQQAYGAAAQFTVNTFAASMDSTTGTLVGLLAVTVASPSYNADLVFALSGPAGTDPSQWLGDSTRRVWTPLPCTPADLPPQYAGLLQNGPSVTALRIELGIDSTAPMIAVALVEDPAGGGDQIAFQLDVTGGDGSWSFFRQENSITNLLGFDEGLTSGNDSWGVYKLYGDGQTLLTFEPLQALFGPGPGPSMVLAVDPTATAIASLVYQPTANNTATDLFVAAAGTIYCFPYDATPDSSGIAVITNPLIADVTQMHAVNAGDTAFLWGLTSGGLLFYSQAPIDRIEQPGAWSLPVPLLTGVTAAGALSGAPADECGVCALLPVTAGTTTGTAAVAPVILTRNPVTGHWQQTTLPAPSTTDCITLQTYTTRVQPMNGSTPLAGTAIPTSASGDCTLIVNGSAMSLTAGTAVTLTTDMSGCLNLIYSVSSLAGLAFTFTLPDGTSQTVRCAQNVTTQLSAVTSDVLTSATYKNAAGVTVPLVAGGTSPDVVASVASGTSLLAVQSGSRPSAFESSLDHRRAAARAMAAQLDDGSILLDLGDLVQWVVHVVDEVGDVVLNAVSEGIQIVVSVAEQTFSAIIQTAEDALHAIGVLLKWIGAAFDAIFRWLAFLFDWGEIVQVHGLLSAGYQQMLASLNENFPALTTALLAYLGHVKSEVLPGFDPNNAYGPMSGAPTPTAAFNAQVTPPAPVNGMSVPADARIGWVNDRASTPPANAPAIAPGTPGDAVGDLQAALAALGTDLEALIENLAGDVASLADGSLSPKQFLISVTQQLVAIGIDGLTTIVQAFAAAAGDVFQLVNDVLTAEIDIPILSALYRVVTQSALSLLDVACLLQAIVVTFVYRVLLDQNPVDALQSLGLPAVLTGAMQALPGQVTAAAGGQTRPTVSRPAAVAVPSGLDIVTGSLLLTQAATALAVGAGEIKESPLTSVAYTVDVLTRFSRGAMEARDPQSPEYAGGTLLSTELACTSLIAVAVCVVGTGKEVGNQAYIRWTDAFLSLGWGIWEIVNMGKDVVDCDPGHICETGIELAELPAALLCRYANPPTPPLDLVTYLLVGMRAMMALCAGISRVSGGDESGFAVAR